MLLNLRQQVSLLQHQADYPFVHWDFEGNTQQECDHLMAIFKEIGQEVYIADYEHLGVYGCRIIAPGLSDIYPADDLIWSNIHVLNISRIQNREVSFLSAFNAIIFEFALIRIISLSSGRRAFVVSFGVRPYNLP